MQKHTVALICWIISGCQFAVPSFDIIDVDRTQHCLLNGDVITKEELEEYRNSIVALASLNSAHGLCSGILIASNLVLSAGHCVTINSEIRIGSDSRKPVERVRIARTIRHPDYPDPDLAIWVLDESPKIAKPWGLFADVEEGDIVRVMGFGSAKQEPEDKGPLRTATGVVTGFADDDRVEITYCSDAETEKGDSGSPIFNEEGRIVAILTHSVSSIFNDHKTQLFTLGPTTYNYLTWITEVIVEYGNNDLSCN